MAASKPTTNGHAARAFPFGSPDGLIPIWVNGKQIASDASTHTVVSPLTNEPLYRTTCATASDVDSALSAAAAALPSWSDTSLSARRDILLRAADILETWRDEAFEVSRRETGAPQSHFDFDFAAAIEGVRSVAGLIQVAGAGTVPAKLRQQGQHAMLLQEPFGVVFGIAPWNAPNVLGTRASIGPIAMGNTVILKGPEQAPGVYWLWTKAFHEAGLPDGVLSTIFFTPTTAPELVTRVIASPVVKKLSYTGSAAIGSLVAQTAGKHLKPVLMELGGKAPAIVCSDADLDLAATHCALGSFMYAGQICMSTERIIVHDDVAAEFADKLRAKIDHFFGDAAAAGAPALHLIAPAGVEKNRRLIDDALAKGAKALYGGGDQTERKPVELATAMRPIVVEGVADGMDLYRTESFGPTVSLFRVGGGSGGDGNGDEEALAIANDTEYGLSASVFTRDLARGFRLARRIESGAVHVNTMSVHDEPGLPHGGAKASGWGRFNGVDGLREWVRMKTITWVE